MKDKENNPCVNNLFVCKYLDRLRALQQNHFMTASISAVDISKRFRKHSLFSDISFTCSAGESFAVTGPNGSGKSTLLKILAKLSAPTKGAVAFYIDGKTIPEEDIRRYVGFCSPELNLYENLTGLENLQFACGLEKKSLAESLADFQLKGHENKLVRFYSSGMKQRLKILCAVINRPPLLFLDEPGFALDEQGKKLIYETVEKLRESSAIILATNESAEAAMCGRRIELG